MTSNFVDSVKDFITPDMINKASSYLGESNESITKAIGVAIPTVLAGLIGHAEAGNASTVLDSAKEAAGNNVLGNVSNLFSGSSTAAPATSALTNLFGNNAGNIVSTISNVSGIKSSSASSLLNMITPLILGVIGKHTLDNNLNSGGLLSLLSGHKSSILSALPAGLNIGDLLSTAKKTIASVTGEVHSALDAPKRNWLMPVVIWLIVLIAIIYFVRGCNKSPEASATATDTTSTMSAPADTAMGSQH